MTQSGSPTLGDIKDRSHVDDKLVADVATNTTLGVGLVYQDGANGLKDAPIDGTIPSSRLYFNPISINNSVGAKGAKTATVYGVGAIVIGTIQGAITVKQVCRASNTTAQAFEGLTIRTDTVENNSADRSSIVAIYLGHAGESVETNNDPSNGTDMELGQFLIVRGN